MTSLTTTGSTDAILGASMSDLGDAFESLALYFASVFYTVDVGNTTNSFSETTRTATALAGYDAVVSGQLSLTGTNLLFNPEATPTTAGSGTYTSGSYASGPDPGAGAFAPDGAGSFSFLGALHWSFDGISSGANVTGTFTSLTISHGTESLTLKGSGLMVDESGDVEGIATQEILTVNGVTVTLTGSINTATSTGTLTSVLFDDHSGDTVKLLGTLHAEDFLNGGHTLVSDYFQDSLILSGADVLFVPGGGRAWHGFAGNDKMTGGANADTFFGDGGNDILTGLGGGDTLDGGTGADTMTGGLGDDTYYADNALDKAIEATAAGTDTVFSSASYILGANVENLTLTGSDAVNGTGNALNNIITGNSGANTLKGGLGNDSLVGGDGDDVYIFDNAGDTVDESGTGTDTVIIAYANADRINPISLSLAANIENLKVTGTGLFNLTGDSNANVLTGNASINTITGGGGNDIFDGGAGADRMVGGSGDDTYTVDVLGDVIVDSGGNDVVFLKTASGTYLMTAGIEELQMLGTAAINATGDSGNNAIYGNAGANILDGGAGDDILAGGLGNDTYVVDSVSDTVSEDSNGGTDLIRTSVDFNLPANVENALLLAAAQVNGNELKNTLTGSTGNDILDGGQNADKLAGGNGNDIYYVDNPADVVVETTTGGTTDLVISTVNWTLGSNLERLTLSGTALVGTGNSLANIITGNASANTLSGGAGDDSLIGGDGSDTLLGGLGADTFVFDHTTAYSSVDIITDFSRIAHDHLDIRDLLTGYNPGGGDLLIDFVQMTQNGINTNVYVDADGTGGGAASVLVATLLNTAGLASAGVDALAADGTLIIS